MKGERAADLGLRHWIPMARTSILGLTVVLLSGCYDEPPVPAPTYPNGFAYNPAPENWRARPYVPDRSSRSDDRRPRNEEAEPEVSTQPAPPPGDSDDTMRSLDDEEVIGGDDPPPDHPIRRSTRSSIERHRDHRGDYRP
jgi:hypothetical protein